MNASASSGVISTTRPLTESQCHGVFVLTTETAT